MLPRGLIYYEQVRKTWDPNHTAWSRGMNIHWEAKKQFQHQFFFLWFGQLTSSLGLSFPACDRVCMSPAGAL